MTHHADHPATAGGFAFCDPASVFLPPAPVFSPVARFSRVASRAEPASHTTFARSTMARTTFARTTFARTTMARTTMTAPPLEGTAVSTTPSSDVRPEGARL